MPRSLVQFIHFDHFRYLISMNQEGSTTSWSPDNQTRRYSTDFFIFVTVQSYLRFGDLCLFGTLLQEEGNTYLYP